MRQRPSIDAWWSKIVPQDSLKTKIILYIAEFGPSSPYDIAKKFYTEAPKGYANVFRNVRQLETEKILKKTRTGQNEKTGRKKSLYSFTEFIGIPCAWAYAGSDLDFAGMMKVHEPFFRHSIGVDAYRVMWAQLGPKFCVQIARKSFLGIIEGLDDRTAIFNMLVSYILDGTLLTRKIVALARQNDLFTKVIVEVRDELGAVISAIGERDQRSTATDHQSLFIFHY